MKSALRLIILLSIFSSITSQKLISTTNESLYSHSNLPKQTINYTGRIIPTPQNVLYGSEFSVGELTDVNQIVIILTSSPDSMEELVAEMLFSHLSSLNTNLGSKVIVANSLTNLLDEPDLVIEIGMHLSGDTAFSFEKLIPYFPIINDQIINLPTEGYQLVVEGSPRPTVSMFGNDRRGLFFALQSFKQLLNFEDDSLILKEVAIFDYPSYSLRISGNDENIPGQDIPLEAVSWLSFLKFNGWAVGQSYWWPKDWREIPDNYLEVLSSAANEASKIEFDLVYQLHPFGRADDPDKHYTINISDAEELTKVNELAIAMIEEGARTILLRADDYHALSEQDTKTFVSKAEAHSFIINEMFSAIREVNPESKLVFCPPYYWGNSLKEGDGESYIKEISQQLSEDISIMWTGMEVVSTNIAQLDDYFFSQLTGRKPLLWDNTALPNVNRFGYPYSYAFYLFQPFVSNYHTNHPISSEGIRFNFGFNGSEVFKVGNAVLSDFLWNPKAFNSEASLENALALVVGRKAVNSALELSNILTLAFDLRHSPAFLLSTNTRPNPVDVERLITKLNSQTTNLAFIQEMNDMRWTLQATITAIDTIAQKTDLLEKESLLSIVPDDKSWSQHTSGDWSIIFPNISGETKDNGIVTFSFPFNTPSFASAKAEIYRDFYVPASSSEKYFLHFLADDNYYAEGSPPSAWPGYFFKEILINNRPVWSMDVVGFDNLMLREVDVTDYIRAEEMNKITIRATDKQGVYNLGVDISFSKIFLSSRSIK